MRDLVRGVVVAVLALVLLECAFRVVATLRETPSVGEELTTLGVEFSPELGWTRRPNFHGTLAREPGRPERRFDARGFIAGDAAASGAPTIVTIGDSSTFGWGAPADASFPRVLDRLMPDVRVVNLGVLGYTSFQGYKALEKYAPELKPQLVIVASNFNDRRYVLSVDDQDSSEKFERYERGRRINAITSRIYLYRAIAFAMTRAGLVDTAGQRRREVYDVGNIPVRVPPERYRENLVRFAEYGKRAGTPIVFMTMADNPAHTEYLRRGLASLEKGDLEAATRDLEIAVNLENSFSDLARKYLAQALEKQGAHEEAAAARRLGRVQHSAAGGKVMYLDSEYNAIMRSVASEHGVSLLDVAAGPGRDPSLFVDFCHPNERGYRAIAQLLHQRVEPLLAAQARMTSLAGPR